MKISIDDTYPSSAFDVKGQPVPRAVASGAFTVVGHVRERLLKSDNASHVELLRIRFPYKDTLQLTFVINVELWNLGGNVRREVTLTNVDVGDQKTLVMYAEMVHLEILSRLARILDLCQSGNILIATRNGPVRASELTW